MRDRETDEFIFFCLLLVLAIGALAWVQYSYAIAKCKKAGNSPAFCYDALR